MCTCRRTLKLLVLPKQFNVMAERQYASRADYCSFPATAPKSKQLHNIMIYLYFSQQAIVSRFMTETSDITAEKMRNLTSDNHFVECQLQSLLTALLSVMAKQCPGETLSSLTGRKRAAIASSDVLTEIHCQPVQGMVLHSQVYNNTFSSRPLVEFLINGTRKVGQIWSNCFLYEGICFREQHISLEKVVTFRINQTFYSYENYTLRSTSTQVNQLLPSLHQTHYEHTPVDYAEALICFQHIMIGIIMYKTCYYR